MKVINFAKAYRQVFICLIISLNLPNVAWTAPLPASVNESLQQHEASLQHTDFAWKVNVEEQRAAMPATTLDLLCKQMEKDETAEFERNGMTNKKQIQKLVQGNIKNFIAAASQDTIHYTDLRQFTRDAQSVLVTGNVQYSGNSTHAYRQFYNGMSALLVEDDNRFASGQRVAMPEPIVWMSSGGSIRNFAPVVQGLNLYPEHFTMLIGLNPLAVHEAQWKLISTTTNYWVLASQIKYAETPIDIEMTLDKEHGNAPAIIKMKTAKETEIFSVKSFRRYQDGWICDDVLYKRNVPGSISVTQQWSLQNLGPSKPIIVSLSQRRQVHDFRLLGRDLSWQDIQNNDTQHSKSVVYYAWPGHFPSLDILKKIYQRQNPGEASPDVGQNGVGSPTSAANIVGSTLPFAGGILCLVGGVWMFKQRRAN